MDDLGVPVFQETSIFQALCTWSTWSTTGSEDWLLSLTPDAKAKDARLALVDKCDWGHGETR